MIEIVAAVLLVLALPLANRSGLVLHEDAFLELSIEVLAAVTSVHGDEHGVKLLLRVLLRMEDVVGDRRLEVEECHLFLLLLIIIIT